MSSTLESDLCVRTKHPEEPPQAIVAQQALHVPSTLGSELCLRTKHSAEPQYAIAAQKAFDVVEILENIMLNLSARSLLRAMCAQRCFRDTVLGSLPLRRCLRLEPAAPGTYYRASCHVHKPLNRKVSDTGMPSGWITEEKRRPRRIVMSAWIDTSRLAKGQLGSRLRAMLFCSPPVHKLDAFINFWTSSGHEGRDGRHMAIVPKHPNGHTIGELIDLATEWSKEPYRQGFIISNITFRGSIHGTSV